MNIFINISVLIIGGLLALQGVVNAKLSSFLNHPIQAATISFIVGTTSLAVIFLAIKAPLPNPSLFFNIPPYLFAGGIFGAIMVSSAIVLIPKIGATSFISGIIVGQLLGALLLDHFGVLGLTVNPVNVKKILGILLLILGFYLTRK